jgi:hypothetical protein
MATTIQIDEKTKQELFFLKNELEKNLARSLTYNEILQILLEKYRIISNVKHSWAEFRSLKGSISKDSLEILRKGRKIDKKAEEYE